MKSVLQSFCLAFTLVLGATLSAQSLSGSTWDAFIGGGIATIHFGINDSVYAYNPSNSPVVIATYEVSADTMKITDIPGTSHCGTDVGIYTFTIKNDSLNFNSELDLCTDRETVLAGGVWYKSAIAGISELKVFIDVFPNPFMDQLIINLQGIDHETSYSLSDFSGTVVSSGRLTGLDNSIPTSQLPVGAYVVQIPEYLYSQKLIKL